MKKTSCSNKAYWILLCGLIVIGGCCKVSTGPAALEKRVTAFWHAREAGEVKVDYNGAPVSLYDEFLSTETKKIISEKDYYSILKLKIINPSIANIEYDKSGMKATVTIQFSTRFRIATIKGIEIKQQWIVEDGKWRLLDNPKRSPYERDLLK